MGKLIVSALQSIRRRLSLHDPLPHSSARDHEQDETYGNYVPQQAGGDVADERERHESKQKRRPLWSHRSRQEGISDLASESHSIDLKGGFQLRYFQTVRSVVRLFPSDHFFLC